VEGLLIRLYVTDKISYVIHRVIVALDHRIHRLVFVPAIERKLADRVGAGVADHDLPVPQRLARLADTVNDIIIRSDNRLTPMPLDHLDKAGGARIDDHRTPQTLTQ
jgi:hypothetical protein